MKKINLDNPKDIKKAKKPNIKFKKPKNKLNIATTIVMIIIVLCAVGGAGFTFFNNVTQPFKQITYVNNLLNQQVQLDKLLSVNQITYNDGITLKQKLTSNSINIYVENKLDKNSLDNVQLINQIILTDNEWGSFYNDYQTDIKQDNNVTMHELSIKQQNGKQYGYELNIITQLNFKNYLADVWTEQLPTIIYINATYNIDYSEQNIKSLLKTITINNLDVTQTQDVLDSLNLNQNTTLDQINIDYYKSFHYAMNNYFDCSIKLIDNQITLVANI